VKQLPQSSTITLRFCLKKGKVRPVALPIGGPKGKGEKDISYPLNQAKDGKGKKKKVRPHAERNPKKKKERGGGTDRDVDVTSNPFLPRGGRGKEKRVSLPFRQRRGGGEKKGKRSDRLGPKEKKRGEKRKPILWIPSFSHSSRSRRR